MSPPAFAGIEHGGNHVGQALQGRGDGPQCIGLGHRFRRIQLFRSRGRERVGAGRWWRLSRPVGRFNPSARVPPRQCGLDSRVEARFPAFAPLHPVDLHTSAVSESLVVTTMAVFKHAPMHPSRSVLAADCYQRPPQFLIEHHGGKAPIRAHPAARVPMLVTARSRCRYVTDSLSTGQGGGSGWVTTQYPLLPATCRGFSNSMRRGRRGYKDADASESATARLARPTTTGVAVLQMPRGILWRLQRLDSQPRFLRCGRHEAIQARRGGVDDRCRVWRALRGVGAAVDALGDFDLREARVITGDRRKGLSPRGLFAHVALAGLESEDKAQRRGFIGESVVE
jgi:hypothetical protein